MEIFLIIAGLVIVLGLIAAFIVRSVTGTVKTGLNVADRVTQVIENHQAKS